MHVVVSLLIILLLVQIAMTSFSRNWMLEDRLPWEEDSDVYRGWYSRGRRSDKMKLCGGKIFKMVVVACGGGCASNEQDIATKCCTSQCAMDEIVSLCCPAR